MPKVVTVTDDNMNWLREHHDTVTLTEAAERIGVCVDTLKGFSSEKVYATSRG